MSNNFKSGNLLLHVKCENNESKIINSHFILFNNETSTYNIYSYIKKNFTSYSYKYTNNDDINTITRFLYMLLKDEGNKMKDNYVFYKLYELSTNCFKNIIDCKTTNYINIKNMITDGENKSSFLIDVKEAIRLENEYILTNYINMIRNISIINKELNPIVLEYKNDLDKHIDASNKNITVHSYDYPY